MTFREVLAQVIDWLQQDKRVSYRALKREFDIDDAYIEDLKEELIEVRECAVDRDNKMLVWSGDTDFTSSPIQSIHQGEETESRFHAVLPAVIVFLQHEGCITYRTLTYVFGLNDGLLTEIREELLLRQVAIDEGGKVLVWTGKPQPNIPPSVVVPSQQVTSKIAEVAPVATPSVSPLVTNTETRINGPTALSEPLHPDPQPDESVAMPEPTRNAPDAERRQLTVMFCDLVGSTDLSGRLDPEDLREVVKAYQEAAAKVIERYEGHIAQYLGDGLLIYHGFPVAHENDAERAVHTGLEIPVAIAMLNSRLETDYGVQLTVRIGIHTGPVVVGEMGGGDRHENLALGETPNISARLEGLAKPNTVVISPVTAQLVQRAFVLEELGLHELKGVAEPMMLYAVVGSHEADHDDHEEMLSGGFDALVGRDEEIGLLLRRWEQSKDGQGQVVLISGEAGLGKSSLVEGLRAHVRREGVTRISFRCSPYTANSAMHPVIEHIQRVLGWQREDSTETKLDKLEQAFKPTSLPVEETVPLLAALLSLPVPEDRYPALTLSPQRQRHLTQDALVAWMLEEAERQPVLAVWEDLHWADPSTLELLGLFIEQVPTVPMLHVLAFRPEFVSPWPTQSHMTPLTLNRLERIHIEALVRRLAGGKRLPQEVETHIVTKTDGVPLYVEELAKMLLESDLLEEHAEQYVLTGSLSSAAIPATLQDSLMARLDRLPEVREVAQLGAVLGREFDYEMIQSLAALDDSTLQSGLSQLVSHELLYQRGRIPRARYIFRHALIRDAAYQSLLRRTRQQHHQRIAQTLEERFRETAENQLELLAHHYGEAGLYQQAVDAWHQSGKQALSRSATREAALCLEQALTLLSHISEDDHSSALAIDIHIDLRNALHGLAEYDRILDNLYEAERLAESLNDFHRLGQILSMQTISFTQMGEHSRSLSSAQRVLALAKSQDDVNLEVLTNCSLGGTYRLMGNYSQAIDVCRKVVHALEGEQRYEHFNRLVLPSVTTRYYLASCLAECGNFVEGEEVGKEAVAIAESADHTISRIASRYALGLLYVRRGNMQEAIALFEQGTEFSQGVPFFFPFSITLLGAAYALGGRVADALTLLEQAGEQVIEQSASAGQNDPGAALVNLTQIALIAGHLEKAQSRAERCLTYSQSHSEKGNEARSSWLLGEIGMKQKILDLEQTVPHYQQALTLANELAMCPLQAHCHRGLGTLYSQTGQVERARAELSAAIEMYRDMEMNFWRPETEAALAAVERR